MLHSERRRRLFPISVVSFFLLATVVAAAAVSQTRSEAGLDGRGRTVAVSTADGQAGFRVFLDDHGKPTTPSPAQRNVPSGYSTAPDEAPLVEFEARGGGRGLVLDGRYRSYSVARVGEDGTVSVECRLGDPGHAADGDHGTHHHPAQREEGGTR
jgi:hypothetical protein